MAKETSFREENRRRRETNAFENLYGYAREHGIRDPKRTAERTARAIHTGGTLPPVERLGSSTDGIDGDGGVEERRTPHRLEDRTRDELYERAQALDIEGRSRMTKDELVEAIRASR
jgi:hypothetical protein